MYASPGLDWFIIFHCCLFLFITKILVNFQLERVRVRTGGNCLFECLAHQLDGDYSQHMKYRSLAFQALSYDPTVRIVYHFDFWLFVYFFFLFTTHINHSKREKKEKECMLEPCWGQTRVLRVSCKAYLIMACGLIPLPSLPLLMYSRCTSWLWARRTTSCVSVYNLLSFPQLPPLPRCSSSLLLYYFIFPFIC